jgi:hypothetical protein
MGRWRDMREAANLQSTGGKWNSPNSATTAFKTLKHGQPKLATSYSPVALALEQEVFQHRKISTSRFAYFQGQSCHLHTTLGAPVCGRGAKIFSTTKRRSSGRSI